MTSRKLRLLLSAVSLIAVLIIGGYVFSRRAAAVTQSTPPPPQASGVAQATGDASQPRQLPPGTILYSPKAATLPVVVARNYLSQSSYMTVAAGIEPQPVVEKNRPYPRDEEVRAVYLTGATAGSVHGIDLIRRWKQAGGNAVVFDIKDSDGSVNIPFSNPLAPKRKNVPISNLPKFIRFVHAQDMHAIARIALFRDNNIAQNHSTLAVQSRSTHKPWLEKGKLVWTDPSQPQVQDYDLALAKLAADSGADEIQFDYVRFPAEGDQKDALFVFQSNPKLHRDDVIAAFLHRAYDELHPKGVLLSLDVFGIMAWQRSVDLNHTGQDIVKMAKYCDVLSPMIYPSHFFGMDGYTRPGDAPEHFIGISMDRFTKVTAGSGVVLRPWLQAFHWQTKTYSTEYILTQVSTAKTHGGIGFLFWNAANDYSKPFAAMPTMMSHAATYLKTAAPETTSAQASPAKPDAPANK